MDVIQRTQRTIKACRVITDIIPYDKRNQVLLEEPGLIKYLLLAHPLNPGAVTILSLFYGKIQLIIKTIIDKFKKLLIFQREIWSNFDFISQLEEAGDKVQKTGETALKLLQLGVKKLLRLRTLKELDENTIAKDGLKVEYCEDIMKNREAIKLKCLEFVEKMVVIYFKVEFQHFI
jgi:hypothetical protein